MASRLALLSAALVGMLHPAQAHDIYSHLTDERGASCCDDSDCRPAPYRFVAGSLNMFVDGHWIEVPQPTIQYRALLGDTGETDGGHWCGMVSLQAFAPAYHTRCAILPPQAASALIESPDGSGQ